MAEGIMRKKIKERALDWTIDSAGTGPWHVGEAPDSRAQATMLGKGMDISDLRGRQFAQEDFNHFDLILTMDESNYRNVMALARNEAECKKVKRILDFHPESLKEVPDPYWDSHGFAKVYRLLDEATDALIEEYHK